MAASTRKTRRRRHTTTSATKAVALARKSATRYFSALEAEIPYDVAPGEVELIKACNDIADALGPPTAFSTDVVDGHEFRGMFAGYLLGVQIGKRLAGGAR